MVRLSCLALILAILMLPAPVLATGAEDRQLPGWAGPDLDAARRLAVRMDRPILVLVRGPSCAPCDTVEETLTEDPVVAALTEPFIRMRVSTGEEAGRAVAQYLDAQKLPTVLLLGPEGKIATRKSRPIERAWLVEQLQIVARRHDRPRTPPSPGPEEVLASLARLEEWGDKDGARRLALRLEDAEFVPAARQLRVPPEPTPGLETVDDLNAHLDALEDPARLRAAAHAAALHFEEEDRPGLALAAYSRVIEQLAIDPLTEARAGFLATRHGLRLDDVYRKLAEARMVSPDSVPLLMALCRVAEETHRLYQAYHAAEAAAVYAPDDAWINLELHRLRLLVRLQKHRTERSPT
jgi:hypothetical protein